MVHAGQKRIGYVTEINKDAQFYPGFHQVVIDIGKKKDVDT
jgi:hypothetical protein